MGSNLNALDEILRWEGISSDPKTPTYWIWSEAHVLFEADRESFSGIFDTMADCARHVRQAGWGAQTQMVYIMLTGSWQSLGEEASKDESLLYNFPHTRHWSDKSTGFVTLRISP